MKIAICLYGQPRDYKNGYHLINNFINMNSDNTYDIFFHCWLDDNVKFDHSPWRNIDQRDLIIENKNKIEHELLRLYNPISHEYEAPIDKNNGKVLTEFQYIKDSLMYRNMCTKKQNNIYNTFSQIYSRNKVKDIFEHYTINTGKKYDTVISTRFDGFFFPRNLKMPNIQTNKVYTSSIYRPSRYIIPDNFLIIPPGMYISWFNLHGNIKNIINNEDIEKKMNHVNEKFEFNMENYLLSTYIYCGYDLSDVLFIDYETS